MLRGLPEVLGKERQVNQCRGIVDHNSGLVASTTRARGLKVPLNTSVYGGFPKLGVPLWGSQ